MRRATEAVSTDATRKATPMALSPAAEPVNHAPAMTAKPTENAATVAGGNCRASAHLAALRAARSATRPVPGTETAITRALPLRLAIECLAYKRWA
jgi:hypothetical protein